MWRDLYSRLGSNFWDPCGPWAEISHFSFNDNQTLQKFPFFSSLRIFCFYNFPFLIEMTIGDALFPWKLEHAILVIILFYFHFGKISRLAQLLRQTPIISLFIFLLQGTWALQFCKKTFDQDEAFLSLI